MAQQHHNASKKRRREPITVDTKLVEMYEDLANERDEIRLKAAQALVSQFTPDKNPTDEQIKKTLSRLFRGLCSSRKAARVGFSIALTEILTQVFATTSASSEVTIPFVLGIWESQSNASGSETGQVRLRRGYGTVAVGRLADFRYRNTEIIILDVSLERKLSSNHRFSFRRTCL